MMITSCIFVFACEAALHGRECERVAQHFNNIRRLQARDAECSTGLEKLYRRSHFMIISVPTPFSISFLAVEQLQWFGQIASLNAGTHHGFGPRVVRIIETIEP